MERVSCCVCRSVDASIAAVEWDRSHGMPGEWTYLRCKSCRHIYLSPRPTQVEIGQYYPETYREFTTAIDDEPSWFLRWNRQYGMSKRCRVVTGRRRPGRLLDVGSGGGQFIAAMRRRGWAVEGVDASPAAVRATWERFGIVVHQGELGAVGLPAASFDVVTMWHVLEHVADPAGDLREIHRLLRPGGLVVIATPNVDSFDRHLFGRHWALWEAPRHFNLFGASSLTRLLGDAGFGRPTIECIVGNWYGLATSVQYWWEERAGIRPASGGADRRYWDMAGAMQVLRLALLPYTLLTDRVGAGSTIVACADRP